MSNNISENEEPRASELNVPIEVARHLPSFDWDVSRVWSLEATTTPIDIIHFSPWLELPFWWSGSGPLFDLRPIDVMRDPGLVPHQWKRILMADLTYPIDLLEGREGQLLLLDGLHRICKAILDNQTTISARVHTLDIANQIHCIR